MTTREQVRALVERHIRPGALHAAFLHGSDAFLDDVLALLDREREAALAELRAAGDALAEAADGAAQRLRRGMAPAGHMSLEEIAALDMGRKVAAWRALAERKG